MRTTTFFRPPPGPTTTSSSFIGVLAQNGSPWRLVSCISGAGPFSFTVPAIDALPVGPGANAAGALPGAAGAPVAGAAGAAGASGLSFWQPLAVAEASTTNAIPRHERRFIMPGW